MGSPEGPSSQRRWPTPTCSSPDPGRGLRHHGPLRVTSVLPTARRPLPGPCFLLTRAPSAGVFKFSHPSLSVLIARLGDLQTSQDTPHSGHKVARGGHRTGRGARAGLELFSHKSCWTLCDPMDCSTLGFPVHHQLLEFAQTLVH